MKNDVYGILATFEKSDDLIAALKKAIEAGYRQLDTFTPFVLDEVTSLLRIREDRWMPRIALGFGSFGGLSAFLWQTRHSAISYPLNIGGRPYFSWPAYVMPIFDFGIFCAILAMLIGMLGVLKLPRYYHPIFNSTEVVKASDDRFILLIQSNDPKFHTDEIQGFLKSCHPEFIEIVYKT